MEICLLPTDGVLRCHCVNKIALKIQSNMLSFTEKLAKSIMQEKYLFLMWHCIEKGLNLFFL